MGVGTAVGKGKAEEAARIAVSSPLMETSIDGARGVLINITGSADMGLEDVEAAATLVQEAAHPDANIIFGATFDDSMDDIIRVTIIATGFDEKKDTAPAAPVVKEPVAEVPVAEPVQPAELFTAATQMAQNAEPEKAASDEDPFDSIFKIFNSK